MRRRSALLIVAACAACSSGSSAPSPAASASAAASTSAAASASAAAGEPRAGDEDVGPVYPLTRDPPDPRAQKLCEALQATPALRRAECCAEAAPPSPATVGECVRMLSSALRSGALTLTPEDAGRCADAVVKAHEGCGWVGPSAPPAPAACLGILRGTLKEGARCRSSLECEGNQRCHGLGPTDPGTCGPPRRAGSCGFGVDPLAVFARQVDVDAAHPSCVGFCALRRCVDLAPIGGACTTGAACGPGALCASGKCAPGKPPPAGEACPAGVCAEGARCVKGRCVEPRAEGEVCEADAECRGACVRPVGAERGACGMRCVQPAFPRK